MLRFRSAAAHLLSYISHTVILMISKSILVILERGTRAHGSSFWKSISRPHQCIWIGPNGFKGQPGSDRRLFLELFSQFRLFRTSPINSELIDSGVFWPNYCAEKMIYAHHSIEIVLQIDTFPVHDAHQTSSLRSPLLLSNSRRF